MQIQPKSSLRQSSQSRRAKQAAQLSEDAFKGGARTSAVGTRLLRSPWHAGTGQLWETARKRDSQTAAD